MGNGLVAQLAEQRAFNSRVVGSNPAQPTISMFFLTFESIRYRVWKWNEVVLKQVLKQTGIQQDTRMPTVLQAEATKPRTH